MSVTEVGVVDARPDVDIEVQVTAARGGLSLTARVEDAGPSVVVIRPSVGDYGDGAVLDVGEPLTLLWLTPDGARALAAEVATVEGGFAPRWHLRITGPAEAVQRRQAVRVRIELSLTAEVNGTEVRGDVLDISEGGVRAIVDPYGLPPLPGEVISVWVHLEDGDVAAAAQVVRQQQTRDGRWGLSLRFLDLPERVQDRVRRRVFQALREERARNSD